MKAQLERFLTDVWNGRSSIPRGKGGADYIYDNYYAKLPGGGAVATNPLSKDELQYLEDLKKIQTGRSGVLKGQNTGRKIFGASLKDLPARDQVYLAHDFYHFNPADWKSGASGKLITWRVYVNPKSTKAVLQVARKILKDYVDNRSVERPLKAKVAGPRAFGRLDTIVVYTKSEALAGKIATSISGRKLKNSTPELTHAAKPGVSTAMEPPAVTLFRDNIQSFGNYRCEIFAIALDGAKAKKEFLDNVTTFFEIAGLDVNAPERQANKVALEQLEKMGRSAQRRRGI